MPCSKKLLSNLQSLSRKGAFSILFGSFFMKAAAFLGSVILIRVMAKSEFGVLSYMENLYTYAYLLAGYGLNNAVFRYVVLKDKPEEKCGIIAYVIMHGTAFNIALVIVVCLSAVLFPHRSEFSIAAYMLPLMALAIPLQFLFESGTYSLRALFMNREYALFAVLTAMLIWFIKITGAQLFGLGGAVFSWPLSYFIMSIAILSFIKNRVFKDIKAVSVDREERSSIRRYSLQYMITNGLWVMFLQNDLLLLGMLSGNPMFVASYKVAYVIPAAMSIFSSSIGMFVAPYFVKHETETDWVWRNYKRVLASSIIMLGLITACLLVFAQPIVIEVYGSQYSDAIDVMRVLLIAVFISNAIRYTAANLLASMGNVKANMIVSTLGIALQIAFDLLLIPVYGMMGAAFTSVIVYAVMAVAISGVFIAKYRDKQR